MRQQSPARVSRGVLFGVGGMAVALAATIALAIHRDISGVAWR